MTYCNLLFSHVQVKPNQRVKPCCRFNISKHPELEKYNFNDYTLSEILNSPEWNEFRKQSLNGERIDGCSRCYAEEDRGVSSMRVGINVKMDYTEEVKLKYIEMSFGNFCNLKCRTCSVDLSSTWFEEEKQLLPFYKKRNKQNTKVIHVNDEYHLEDYEHVNEIKFTGGEPMLHPNFEKFIDFLVENSLAQNIKLDIFTNCSWFPKNRLVEKLKEFKYVIINLSVDGVGKVNDYLRAPSKWNIVDASCDKWLETNFDVRWTPCVSVYNANNLVEMFEWWFSKPHDTLKVDNKMNITLNTVDYPSYMAPSLVKDKEKTVEVLREYSKTKNFTGEIERHFNHLINKTVNSIMKEVKEEDLEEFLNFSADLDKLRKQNLHDYIEDFEYDFTNYGKM